MGDDVVVQEKRGAVYRLFYGVVLDVGEATFSVRWRDAGPLAAPPTTWPLTELRYMRVASGGDFIHWLHDEETTYWGRVVRRVARRDQLAVMLQVDWGDMVAEWGAAEANRLVTKFEFSSPSARRSWDKYVVVDAAELGLADEARGGRPTVRRDWRAVLTTHNRRVGDRSTAAMPFARVAALRALAGVRPGDVLVGRRRFRGGRGGAGREVRERLGAVLSRAMALEAGLGAGWLRSFGSLRIGWSTADALLVSSRGYVELQFGRVMSSIGERARVVDTRAFAQPVGLREWKDFMKAYVAPELLPAAEWLRALIAEGHLQGVELATLASVAGSRVHMAMQLKLDGRATLVRAAAEDAPMADAVAVKPYIPNFPPSEAALAYFQSTADLDALVARMADALYDFLFDGTDLTPLASELPVADLDQMWVKSGKALGVESRIDLLAETMTGDLVLCDYSEFCVLSPPPPALLVYAALSLRRMPLRRDDDGDVGRGRDGASAGDVRVASLHELRRGRGRALGGHGDAGARVHALVGSVSHRARALVRRGVGARL